MERENLLKEIKRYSRTKTLGVLVFSGISIIGIILATVISLLNIINKVPKFLIILIISATIIGLIVPVLVLFLSEKWRNNLAKPNNEKLFLEYLRIFKENQVKSHFLYYDLVDLFINMISKTYKDYKDKDKKYNRVNSEMYFIIKQNSSNGLANKFIYSNQDGFSELCKKVLDCYNERYIETEFDGKLNRFYTEIKSKHDAEGKNKLTLGANFYLKNRMVLVTKISLLIACSVSFPLVSINSWIFNAVAIFLLIIDIFTSRKGEGNGIYKDTREYLIMKERIDVLKQEIDSNQENIKALEQKISAYGKGK